MSTNDAMEPTRFGVLRGDEDVTGSEDAEGTLGRVRELLFGEAQAAQTQRVTGLEERLVAEIAQLSATFDERLAALRAETRAELEALSHRVDAQGQDKLDRADFGSALRDIAGRLGGGDARGDAAGA